MKVSHAAKATLSALVLALALSACTNSPTATTSGTFSKAPDDGQQVFSTIEDLRLAYDEVGQCSEPTNVGSTSLSCEDKTILGISPSEAERDAEVRALRSIAKSLGHGILVGRNWIISGKDIEPARQKLGGIVAG